MTMPENSDHFWVFGYGSLMWNPGFDFISSHRALMKGVHRSPCIYSWVHRGTKERPGIVFGLDRGGACWGKAFKVAGENFDPTITYLRERELVTNVYLETKRKVRLENDQLVTAVTYITDRNHEQYAGRLSSEELLLQIKGAAGKSGPNKAYILDTAKQLSDMGIKDNLLNRVVQGLNNQP